MGKVIKINSVINLEEISLENEFDLICLCCRYCLRKFKSN